MSGTGKALRPPLHAAIAIPVTRVSNGKGGWADLSGEW